MFYRDNNHTQIHWPSLPIKKQKIRGTIQTQLTLTQNTVFTSRFSRKRSSEAHFICVLL